MQTIDINTTQNVEIQYELAAWYERMMAFIIDFLIMVVSSWLLFLISLAVFGFENALVSNLLVRAPIFFFYTLVSELVTDGQSIGKKALKIKVVKIDGKKPGIYEYLLRWAFRPIDIYLSLGTLATILIISSDASQRIGDILAHTTVIKTSPKRRIQLKDILKIQSLENYTPQYPDIRKMSEEDMLVVMDLIKSYQRYPNRAHSEALVMLTDKIKDKLNLTEIPPNKKEFLTTLLKDYIVLTR